MICVQLVSQILRLKVWERSEMEVTFVLGRFTTVFTDSKEEISCI